MLNTVLTLFLNLTSTELDVHTTAITLSEFNRHNKKTRSSSSKMKRHIQTQLALLLDKGKNRQTNSKFTAIGAAKAQLRNLFLQTDDGLDSLNISTEGKQDKSSFLHPEHPLGNADATVLDPSSSLVHFIARPHLDQNLSSWLPDRTPLIVVAS